MTFKIIPQGIDINVPNSHNLFLYNLIPYFDMDNG